jgi:hypothetical protein
MLPVWVYITSHATIFCKFSSDEPKEAVHYQTISPASLAKSVLDEGGWSKLVVSFPHIPLFAKLELCPTILKYQSLFDTVK